MIRALPVLVDHDILGLEVAVDDPESGLPPALRRPAWRWRLLCPPQVPVLPDQPLQVLPRHILHGDESRALGLAQVEHPADVPVADLSGQLQLVREALDGLLVQGDLGPDKLEGDLLLDVACRRPCRPGPCRRGPAPR